MNNISYYRNLRLKYLEQRYAEKKKKITKDKKVTKKTTKTKVTSKASYSSNIEQVLQALLEKGLVQKKENKE